jgi:MOSC domain-containing protein YiiM
MFQGNLAAIYICSVKTGPMQSVKNVAAVAGKGLVGDRYAEGARVNPEQEATLVESEAIEAAVAESGLEFAPELSRRNLLSRGVPLNHLVGKRFRVGEVVLRGLELCEPCGHLEKLTVPGIRKALIHRGGLRAQILESGTLNVGDSIEPLDG